MEQLKDYSIRMMFILVEWLRIRSLKASVIDSDFEFVK